MIGREKMKIYKETESHNPLYTAKLENGVTVEVFGDYAKGSDGKTYYHIGREEGGVLKTVGWSCEVKKAAVVSSD